MSDIEVDVDSTTHTALWSLLGSLVWLLMTRVGIALFVGYLQILANTPRNDHVRLVTQVLRHCKRVGIGVVCCHLQPPVRLVVVVGVA